LRRPKPKRNGQLHLAIALAGRKTPWIYLCMRIEHLQSVAINPVAAEFAAFEPKDPSCISVCSLKAEPRDSFACIAPASNAASKAVLHFDHGGLLQDDWHPSYSQCRHHLPGDRRSRKRVRQLQCRRLPHYATGQ